MGEIHTILIDYSNFNENPQRFTRSSTREVVIIHPVDEISILQELGEISKIADLEIAMDMSTTIS